MRTNYWLAVVYTDEDGEDDMRLMVFQDEGDRDEIAQNASAELKDEGVVHRVFRGVIGQAFTGSLAAEDLDEIEQMEREACGCMTCVPPVIPDVLPEKF